MSYLAEDRKGHILVVINHSDAIVQDFLESMNPEDSGYLFFASELEIDPINSCMVPRHRIATDGEIDGLKNSRPAGPAIVEVASGSLGNCPAREPAMGTPQLTEQQRAPAAQVPVYLRRLVPVVMGVALDSSGGRQPPRSPPKS